ncbi:MAG TPA: hypothetical protein PK087_01590 [Bacilli bacterium]|nr:MAG: hypothetical protein BWY97_01291 [Tenericutes bacterium ADurb.BinA124]HNZ50551.1 hypothetical protein [Bacilli bacterium]HOH17995.1 hypothetical protein [Bacilli bacterium]HPN61120.1 hypothetical protein [Bacilli bacterium]HPX84408.1 hypothetical protein [Bacilli bacterium]
MNDQKPPVEKPDETKEDDSQEQIDHLVEELRDQLEEEGEIRFVRINPKKPSWKTIIITTVLSFIFDLLLIVSINGYLEFTDSKILNIIMLSVLFSVVELILKQVLNRYFFRLVISSFGLVYIPVMIVAFIIAWLFTPDLEPSSNGKVLLFFLIFMVARTIMRMIFLSRNKVIEVKKVKK